MHSAVSYVIVPCTGHALTHCVLLLESNGQEDITLRDGLTEQDVKVSQMTVVAGLIKKAVNGSDKKVRAKQEGPTREYGIAITIRRIMKIQKRDDNQIASRTAQATGKEMPTKGKLVKARKRHEEGYEARYR